MTNDESTYQDPYKTAPPDLLESDISLPRLPEIAIRVRNSIEKQDTTCESLSNIIIKDPALTAYLIQTASSPLYRRVVPPRTLEEVISLLGFSCINNVVMMHCVRNLVELKNATARHLFGHTWERLIVKTSIACFLAKELKYLPIDEVQMAILLSEVGALVILCAMLEHKQTPDVEAYFTMCRRFGRRVGFNTLSKWEVDNKIIEMTKMCGKWTLTDTQNAKLLDIANLSIYHTVLMTVETPDLPKLESLTAFHRLPEALRVCNQNNWLALIVDNKDEIESIITSYK